jgi:large subunit ribosomal protein L31
MKQIHPKYNTTAKIVCNSCKTLYVIGSTIEEASTEVCSNCHPFYTGKQNELVDSDDRISKFKKKLEDTDTSKVIKKRKKLEVRRTRTQEIEAGPKITLRDMLKQTSK